jgi:hypothetical protein
VVLAYYWRVFYYLDARGVSPLFVTGGVCGFLAVLYLLASACVRWVKGFDARAALCILLCGVLFAAANPPLQTPDEHLAWAHGEERRRIRIQRKKDKLDGI